MYFVLIGVENLIVFGASKGGSGATVLTAMVALAAARRGHSIVVSSPCEDLGITLGIQGARGAGFREISSAQGSVSSESMDRLLLTAVPNLKFLPSGNPDCHVGQSLVNFNDISGRFLVDAGQSFDALAGSAVRSLLVIRPCLLSLRRVGEFSLSPTAVVVVDEPGRAIDSRDVADVTGLKVIATVPYDLRIARAVDSGRFLALSQRILRSVQPLVDWVTNGD